MQKSDPDIIAMATKNDRKILPGGNCKFGILKTINIDNFENIDFIVLFD